MSGRKSYLQLMSEGFRMMKQSKQSPASITLRAWTFTIQRDEMWTTILRSDRVKWVGVPSDHFEIESSHVQIGALRLTRHLESNEVRLTIAEEWGIESTLVCDETEWQSFVASLRQLKEG